MSARWVLNPQLKSSKAERGQIAALELRCVGDNHVESALEVITSERQHCDRM